MSKIEKVYPTEEELSLVSSHVRCSAENCSAIFKSTSNLNMHLIRHHKMSGEELCPKDSVRQFYCPARLCAYNKDSKKYFKKLKYLKQHFLKVHATKNFTCNKCDKRFATESFKNMHVKTCGTSFRCSCGSVYNSVEALLTHCRRKGHVSSSPTSGKCEKVNVKKDFTAKTDMNLQKKTERFICPKLSSDISYPVHYIAAVALSELSAPCNISKVMDKCVQTESCRVCIRKDSKLNSLHKLERKQNSSQHTQTVGKCKNLKISAETQTNNDYLKQKCRSPPKIACAKKRKKSMETQTKGLLNGLLAGQMMKGNGGPLMINDKNQIENKADSGFFNNQVSVDDLFRDLPSNYLKGESNLNDERNKDNCSQVANLNCASEKFLQGGEDLYVKRTRMDLSPDNPVKHELFSANSDLMCGKEFETDLNELDMSCKKISNENESLYLMETGSYNMFDINKLCNIETQTEIDNFLTDCRDSSLTLCSTIETQTTDFDPLLYSNMYTQTCDEMENLFNFNFVDIETQTAWPDL